MEICWKLKRAGAAATQTNGLPTTEQFPAVYELAHHSNLEQPASAPATRPTLSQCYTRHKRFPLSNLKAQEL